MMQNAIYSRLNFEDLSLAAFFSRGENILLAGGPATGKTTIANTICLQAERIGLTSHNLGSPQWAPTPFRDSMPFANGYSSNQRGGLPQVLLDCDVLHIDEAHCWLQAWPTLFMCLLARRIELGKSNILIFPGGDGWQSLSRANSKERQAVYQPSTKQISWLHGSTSWPQGRQMGLALQNTQTFASMLEILGVGVLSRQDDRRADAFINRMIVPRNRHAEQLCHALGLYPMAWLHADGPDARSRQAFAQAHCYFEKPPLWHIFYTGETAFTRGSR